MKNTAVHKYKLGTVLEGQGARLKIVNRFEHEGRPAYDVVSPFGKGEPWAMEEHYLETSRVVRERKGEFDKAEAAYKAWAKKNKENV